MDRMVASLWCVTCVRYSASPSLVMSQQIHTSTTRNSPRAQFQALQQAMRAKENGASMRQVIY